MNTKLQDVVRLLQACAQETKLRGFPAGTEFKDMPDGINCVSLGSSFQAGRERKAPSGEVEVIDPARWARIKRQAEVERLREGM